MWHIRHSTLLLYIILYTPFCQHTPGIILVVYSTHPWHSSFVHKTMEQFCIAPWQDTKYLGSAVNNIDMNFQTCNLWKYSVYAYYVVLFNRKLYSLLCSSGKVLRFQINSLVIISLFLKITAPLIKSFQGKIDKIISRKDWYHQELYTNYLF